MSDDPMNRNTPGTPFRPIVRDAKPTVETPAIPDSLAAVLAEIQESVKAGFVRVNANIEATHEAVDNIQRRVADLEAISVKGRTGVQKTYSGQIDAVTGKVAQISDSDLRQNSVIGVLVSDLASAKSDIAALTVSQGNQTRMLTEVWESGKAFIDSPSGRIIKGLLYLSLAGYAATRGIHIGP